MPGLFFNCLIYKAFEGMVRREIACFRVRIPRSSPYLSDFIELIQIFFRNRTILGPNAQKFPIAPTQIAPSWSHLRRSTCRNAHRSCACWYGPPANDPFLWDAGGELLADECVSYSVWPTIAYLGFFQMSTPKVISYRTAPSDWCGLFVWR